jgi:hypothetical protein
VPIGGTAGQILKKNTSTNYDALWANDLNIATLQTAVIAPAAITNTSGGLMAGLAGSITPVRSGKVFVTISGFGQNGTAGSGTDVTMRYGTGTAPVNGAALTGTSIGARSIGVSSTALARVPFSVSAVITGLTLGTPIWLDLQHAAFTSGSSTIQVAISAYELP